MTVLPGGAPTGAGRDRRTAIGLSVVLLLAGVLVGISPLLPVVGTADGSPTTAAVGAGFVAVLPGLFAVVLALRRPLLGLAATAGAGLIGLVRVLTDLAVLTEADRITRPELFAETTDRARPLTAAGGGWLLVLADLLWLAVGIVAAVRLAPALAGTLASPADGFFRPPPADPAAPRAGSDPDDAQDRTEVGAALAGVPTGRRPLNLPMIVLGFLGSVLLMVGALGTPYQGGYLALRVLPFGSSLTGLLAAVLLGFLTAVIVVVAAALPRAPAAALLGGTALAAAVPSLTAIAAVLTGAPTGLSPVVWCGVAGAAILAAAALLTRSGRPASGTDGSDGAPPGPWMTWGTGVAGLLSAAALLAAWRSPLLLLDGAAPDEVTGGALLPAALPHLVAAVPCAVAGVLALVPRVAPIGRAALTVLWAGAVYAFGQGLWVRSLVLSTTGNTTGTEHAWTSGPGAWFSILGAALAGAAAVLGALTLRGTAQASLEVVDDDTLSATRVARRWPAVALTVLVVLALAVPAYSDLTGPGPGMLHGSDLDTWGFWLLAVGALIGVWAAALTARRWLSVAWAAAAAAVVAQPLFVPEPVTAVPGFGYGAGRWLMLLAVVALLGAAGWFGAVAGRVRIEESPWPAGDGGGMPAPSVPSTGNDAGRSARPTSSGASRAAQPKGR